jgi:glycosyltransferase involved in cell wall biosynthesis
MVAFLKYRWNGDRGEMRISVIIPVFNEADNLAVCLRALLRSRRRPDECIVVDDGSTDSSCSVAEEFGVTTISTGGRFGPAKARNIGARKADGELLVFVDADVAIHSDALELISCRFNAEPSLDALSGAYDDSPSCPRLVSQFKNLMHSFVHRLGKARADSFWCGCGAVKREVYLEHGGLDETYLRPAIEDIEFGYRLRLSGCELALDPQIQGKHLKTWTIWTLLQTDVFRRGIPWTQLILRTGFLPDDLNLRWNQRISVALTGLLVWLGSITAWQMSGGPTASVFLCLAGMVALEAAIVWVNRAFYQFLAERRGWMFSVRVLPLHILYYVYCGLAFALGAGAYAFGALWPSTRPKPILRRQELDQP